MLLRKMFQDRKSSLNVTLIPVSYHKTESDFHLQSVFDHFTLLTCVFKLSSGECDQTVAVTS